MTHFKTTHLLRAKRAPRVKGATARRTEGCPVLALGALNTWSCIAIRGAEVTVYVGAGATSKTLRTQRVMAKQRRGTRRTMAIPHQNRKHKRRAEAPKPPATKSDGKAAVPKERSPGRNCATTATSIVRHPSGSTHRGHSCHGAHAVQPLGISGDPPDDSCTRQEACTGEQKPSTSLWDLLASVKRNPEKAGLVLATTLFWGSMGCLGGCILGWCTGV